jgi:hypothetical protein
MRYQEPLDFMNLARTYVMFIQHISVMQSPSYKDYFYNNQLQNIPHHKQHQNFLDYDLPAKALRYKIHDYMIRRLHPVIFRG